MGPERVQKIGVQQEIDAGLGHHLEEQRLVDFGIEGRDGRHVVGGIAHVAGRRAHLDEPLDDLLGDAADDALVAGVERHPRSDHRGGRGTAQKAVALDEQRARAVPRRRQRSRATGVAAADDQNVVCHGRAFAAARARARELGRGYFFRQTERIEVSATGSAALPCGCE